VKRQRQEKREREGERVKVKLERVKRQIEARVRRYIMNSRE
jgi:predicted DNA-binding antitoxin AbrB/MazE fold protein